VGDLQQTRRGKVRNAPWTGHFSLTMRECGQVLSTHVPIFDGEKTHDVSTTRACGAGLALAALTLSAPAALACPSYNNPTVFGSANIPANFMPDPWVRNVTAGGRVSLQSCGFNWPGFVVSRPDFRFYYSGTSPTGQLTIALEARSNVDTMLLVNTPDGRWHFNDDYRGTEFRDHLPQPDAGSVRHLDG
jgi:hypothetical protein